MLNIAVLDDDESFVDELRENLKAFFGSKGMEFNFIRFTDGAAFLSKYKPIYDIVFMDICMPYMSGLETARRLREIDDDVMLIFISRMAGYSINGYDVSAFDFIVKPMDYASFALKMERTIPVLKRKSGYKFMIGGGDSLKVLDSKDIYYVEVFTHDIVFHTADGSFHSRNSLKNINSILEKYDFVHAHRCYLVNLRHVKAITSDSVVCGNETIKIGRTYKKSLLAAIANYYNQ
ncbi:MAG: LytTR family DNA-binding domain-containing protein [Clostridia bacterium]|nr:LytTR family DNA-binding domain-containing protein [Clostridia bacterium]